MVVVAVATIPVTTTITILIVRVAYDYDYDEIVEVIREDMNNFHNNRRIITMVTHH